MLKPFQIGVQSSKVQNKDQSLDYLMLFSCYDFGRRFPLESSRKIKNFGVWKGDINNLYEKS